MYNMLGAGTNDPRFQAALKASNEAQEDMDRALAVLKRLGSEP